MLWFLLACAIVVGGVAWGWLEARLFVVRRLRLPLLPAGTTPLRILHLSDFHLTPSQGKKIRWIKGLGAHAPDLVVMTGDNLGGAGAIPVLLDSLQSLGGIPGVFVYGSHDYSAPRAQNPLAYFRGPTEHRPGAQALPTHELTRGLEALGWVNLTNERTLLTVGGIRMSFVGVDDPHIARDRFPRASADQGDLHLGVVHAPYSRVLEAFRAEGAHLAMAGHTHGGQVRIPVVGALVTNCDLDRRQARGLSRWPRTPQGETQGKGPMWLHVSAGIGTSPFAPVRFCCRPEATLVEIVPAEA